MTELTITGNIPSKKNLLKLTTSGRGYYDSEVKSVLNDLSDQVAKQWSYLNKERVRVPRTPVIHPAIAVCFYVTSTRSDKDNKYTTILDAMVSGGVLKDDCIEDCNGPVLICKAIRTPSTAGAKIFIEETGDLERLYYHIRSYNFDNYEWLKDAKAEKAKAAKKHFRKI